MAPKRKRNDRRPSVDGSRPSPHRPGDTSLGQHDRDDGNRGRGRGRGPQRRDSSTSNSGRNQPPAQSHSRKPSNSNSMPPPSSPVLAPPKPAIQQEIVVQTTPRLNFNYHYDNLTDDRVGNWAAQGRNEIVQHGTQSRDDVDITELSSLFQEFIMAVIEQRLDATEAGTCVKEILGTESAELIKDSYTFAPHTLFLDSLAILMETNPKLFQPTLRPFLVATEVSPVLMRQILDTASLQQLGLLRSNFDRFAIRHATNLLYRQANYNLLREESEGYSKLINELYPTNISDAEETFERVKALIGTFDLDVGRVLDIVLDVAASMLMKQYRYFVKFLRASSWWPRSHLAVDSDKFYNSLPLWAIPGHSQLPTEEEKQDLAAKRLSRDIAFWDRAREVHLAAFFELGGRGVSTAELDQLATANGDSKGEASTDNKNQWMMETKTLPPPGNHVAAHLLGFKLHYYHSELMEAGEVLPANLLWLAALLVKIGFISIVDLYPHLSPSDEGMEEVRKRQLEKMEEDERATRGGPMNALLMAGELPQGEDDNPNSSSALRKDVGKKPSEAEKKAASAAEAEAKKIDNIPHEQKGSFLVQLLTIGALPEALFILGRFPWMTEAFPDVLNRIHRILHVMLDKVFEDTKPSSTKPSERTTRNIAAVDQSGMPKGHVRLKQLPSKTAMRWPHPDVSENEENQRYNFYWEEWTDNLPVCQSVEDVFTLCNTFLNISGANIGKDEALLSKLASIGGKSLREDKSPENMARWHDLLKRLLVPALNHTNSNASVVNKVWELLHQYPTTTRYTIYAECYEGQISRLPAMKSAFAHATAETRGVMKRVSLTNLSEMAKKLAKISYSSPGIVFKVGLGQLESYSNLIEAFVECAKYFTELSYDVLVWSLLNALGRSRSRVQEDHALTVSGWLVALSRFSGRVFKRYQHLDPTPVLQYVNEQLIQGNSTDLIILNEFLSSMGGIEDFINFTEYQVLSLAGGPCLRRHTLIRAQDKRFDSVKSSQRLMEALKKSDLAAVLLITLAQYRQNVIYQIPEDEAHIKYLSDTVDKSHAALTRYVDFLWSNLDQVAFDALIPSIPDLVKSYGLDVSLAFFIGRASLSSRMFPWKSKTSKDEKEKDEDVKDADKQDDVAMTDAKHHEDDAANDEQKPDESSLFKYTLQPIIESIEETQGPEIWQKLTPEFLTSFWALQLADLYCPDKAYRQERDSLKKEELVISKDRTDMSRRGQERKMDKRKELMQLQISLSEERQEHLLRQAKWKFQLTKLFQTAFPEPRAKVDSISDALLEQCFIPRAMLSMADAEYTFRFIKALHEWNAPGFQLMSLYERLFNANRLRSLIFTCTSREAEYFGHFLKRILEDLSRWHKNESVASDGEKHVKGQPRIGAYEKEGKGSGDQAHHGFAETFDENGKPKTFVEHEQFKDMLFRWHRSLNMALKACMGGAEWMHIRNAITVLKVGIDFFPAIDFMANQFMAQLQKIHKIESVAKKSEYDEQGGRVDLATSAQGAMSELQRRKSKWVMVQAFRPNANGTVPAETDKSSSLRANAAEFKPSTQSRSSAQEEEDGEVQDGKDKSNPANTTSSVSKDSLPPKPSTAQDSRRENTPSAKPSTPKPGYASTSGGSRPTGLPDRPPNSLPTRPDVQIPAHFDHTGERFPQGRGNERRDARDSRNHPSSRDGRTPRDVRDNRDHREPRDTRDGRTGETERAERGRGTDILRDQGRDLPPRPSTAERDRDTPHREPRGGRSNERDSHGTHGHTKPADEAEPMMNPERAAMFAQDGHPRGPESDKRGGRGGRNESSKSAEAINPERAALIGDHQDHTPTRAPRDGPRERGARPQSPRRGGRPGPDSGPPSNSQNDDRPRGYPATDPRALAREPREQAPTPNQSRGDRQGGRDHERTPAERFGDMSAPQHGNFRGDSGSRGAHQDPNYGRLNAGPPGPDIPSGPRGRGRGGGRGGHGTPQGTPSRNDGRFDTPNTGRGSSPDRQPPTGPSSGRGRPNSGPGPNSLDTPTHGDRARGSGGALESTQPDTPKAPAGSGVHPDRLAQMRPQQQSQHSNQPPPPPPPPGRPPSNSGRHSMPSNPPHDRQGPGPRGPPPPPSGPMNYPDAGVPTGPSSNERSRGGGGRRQLAGIQNTLSQASSGPELSRSNSNNNLRRGGQQPRQMLANSDVQVLTGGSPTHTPNIERPDPMRHEGINRGPSNAEDTPGKDHESGRRDRDNRGDRSGRSGHRERERERSPGHEREDKDRRQHRDRRSGAGDGGHRDERDSRPDRNGGGREPGVVPPPPPAGGRDSMGGRDHRHGGGGGAGDSFNSGGAPGGPSGGGRNNRGGNRRDDRPREDRGRKRRSDEGMGNLQNDREKRPRR